MSKTNNERKTMPARNVDLPGVDGPGVSRPKVKAIDIAAGEYVEVRDKRMSWTEKEVDAKTKLAQLMEKHNLTEYIFDDHKVIVIPGKANVKVRAFSESGLDDGEDGKED